MASVAPPGTGPLPPPQSQSTPMQVDNSPSNGHTIPRLSWEGDKMFNIYIHDYCNKRGFTSTARELMREAELGADAAPPINAKQGLLFEWWSVFWVLFQAKSGNANSEDALLYTQHHQNLQKNRNAVNGQPQPGAPGTLGGQPSQVAPNQPPQQQPGQPPMGRLPNGMPVRPPSTHYMANGAMPNGVMNPAMGGQPNQPGQPGQQQMQPGPMSFAALGGQPNGMPGSQQPHGGPQQGHGPQAIPFNPMMTNGPGARPPMNGIPQQSGPRAPFSSPQMAHSPQTGAPGGGQPPQGGPGPSGQPGQHQQAPMAQLGGPSPPHMTPQMNRAMHPPNGAHPGGMGGGPMNPPTPNASGPPTPGFTPGGPGPNPGGRPPSRSRPSPSPSLAARQPPGAPGPQQQQQQQPQGGMGLMGGMMGMGGMGVPGMNMGGGMPGGMPTMGGIPHPGMTQEQFVNHELNHLQPGNLKMLMQEHGFGDKDFGALTPQDKMRLWSIWRQKNPPNAPKVGLPQAGPSGMMMQGQPQPQVGGPQQQRPGGLQHPPQPQVGRVKRNSTSPAEDESQPRNESSPPDRKRIKRSPGQNPASPYAQHLNHPAPPGPPGSGPPGTPQQQPGQPPQMAMMQRPQQMGMIPNGMGASGPSGQPGAQGGHPVPQPSMGLPVMGMGMHGQMQPGLSQQPNHFRPGLPGGPPRPGPPPQFNSTPLTQLGKQTPNQPQQLPPMNGPGKDIKDVKPPVPMQPNGQSSASGPHPSSPRNQPGSAAHTPVPGNQPTPNRPPSGPPGLQGGAQGGPSQPPPPPQTPTQQQGQPQQQLMNPMLSMPMSGMNVSTGDLSMFESEFMGIDQFDDFAPKQGDMFDFNQWFAQADDSSSMG